MDQNQIFLQKAYKLSKLVEISRITIKGSLELKKLEEKNEQVIKACDDFNSVFEANMNKDQIRCVNELIAFYYELMDKIFELDVEELSELDDAIIKIAEKKNEVEV